MSRKLKASTRFENPKDARHGDGQYFTSLPPWAEDDELKFLALAPDLEPVLIYKALQGTWALGTKFLVELREYLDRVDPEERHAKANVRVSSKVISIQDCVPFSEREWPLEALLAEGIRFFHSAARGVMDDPRRSVRLPGHPPWFRWLEVLLRYTIRFVGNLPGDTAYNLLIFHTEWRRWAYAEHEWAVANGFTTAGYWAHRRGVGKPGAASKHLEECSRCSWQPAWPSAALSRLACGDTPVGTFPSHVCGRRALWRARQQP